MTTFKTHPQHTAFSASLSQMKNFNKSTKKTKTINSGAAENLQKSGSTSELESTSEARNQRISSYLYAGPFSGLIMK